MFSEPMNVDNGVSNSDSVKPLKKDDYDKICKHFNTNYMIYTRVTTSVPRVSGGFFSASQSVNVTMTFRI